MHRKSGANIYLELIWIEHPFYSLVVNVLQKWWNNASENIYSRNTEKNYYGLSLRDVGPQDILHFKYKIAILCTLLLSATPINADDAN